MENTLVWSASRLGAYSDALFSIVATVMVCLVNLDCFYFSFFMSDNTICTYWVVSKTAW